MRRLLITKKRKEQERLRIKQHRHQLSAAIKSAWQELYSDQKVTADFEYAQGVNKEATDFADTYEMKVDETFYAAKVGLLAPRAVPGPWTIAYPSLTKTTDLRKWIALGSGWTLWHQAGLSLQEAVYQKQLSINDPERIPLEGLKVLAALQR